MKESNSFRWTKGCRSKRNRSSKREWFFCCLPREPFFPKENGSF